MALRLVSRPFEHRDPALDRREPRFRSPVELLQLADAMVNVERPTRRSTSICSISAPRRSRRARAGIRTERGRARRGPSDQQSSWKRRADRACEDRVGPGLSAGPWGEEGPRSAPSTRSAGPQREQTPAAVEILHGEKKGRGQAEGGIQLSLRPGRPEVARVSGSDPRARPEFSC